MKYSKSWYQPRVLICLLYVNFYTRMDLHEKKISGAALQRCEVERLQYMSDISVYKPVRFVFVNETDTDKRDALRKFGYSL